MYNVLLLYFQSKKWASVIKSKEDCVGDTTHIKENSHSQDDRNEKSTYSFMKCITHMKQTW